ncbi:MAG: hypothetical protein M5T52_18865 [Ignavibacteriaceae bacterium]|nr:hypothetical protein [Ignavibacteriaceae bacterium]
MFKNKKLIISVTEDIDETAYLLQSEKNAKRLFEALEDIKRNKNLVSIKSIEDLESLVVDAKNRSN